jgi:DsbC/DsbD-like thiol-disulfide interchange protein
VITQYGILNTLVREDEPVYGIPFPGTYLVGEDGRVVEKFFHREYQIRETAATVLGSGFEAAFDRERTLSAEVAEHGVTVSATLGASTLSFMQRADLYVRIDLDEGLHVYGRPIPDGYFPLDVAVTAPEGVRAGEPEYPPALPFRIEGLDEDFYAYEDSVEVRVPIVVAVRPTGEVSSLPIEAEVQYQACNDRECFNPAKQNIYIDAPVGQLNLPQRRG